MNKQITIDGNNYMLRQAVDGVYELWINDQFWYGYNSLSNLQQAFFQTVLQRATLDLTVNNVMNYCLDVDMAIVTFKWETYDEI